MHQRLLHEATEAGAERLLQRLPADQRPTLEPLVYQAIHEAVLHYADGLDKVAGRLDPLGRGRARA